LHGAVTSRCERATSGGASRATVRAWGVVAAMLELDQLSKSFGEVRAVDRVSLAIRPGEMVGVIGRSGAGKSTMLRLVNRLIDPTAGRVVFDGADVTRLRGRGLRQWRARTAMIFQQFNLVPRLDVLTNVLVGRISERGTLPSMAKIFSDEERTLALRAVDRLDLVPQALQRAETLLGTVLHMSGWIAVKV
jgi:phosphonate transport system ATP-binding protein